MVAHGKWPRVIVAAVIAAALAASHGQCAERPAALVPAEKLKDGWEEIDQRLLFLMVRLANTEASLDAVERTIAKNRGKRAVQLGDAVKRAQTGNDLMDRKGFTIHSLRHFFKSFCITKGIPKPVVDEWQGHAPPKAASNDYFHLSDEESQRLMNNVPFGENPPRDKNE